MDNIAVSIWCTAYNHEPFIRQCLDGFVIQQTNFQFEVIINEDASTDNTANIIREYEKKYPNIIKPIYQEENQYSQKQINMLATFFSPRARGKYMAICEGDDCWTDPLKLQKQVDFLENNPDYGLVHTNYMVVDECNNTLHKYSRTWPSGEVFHLILNSSYSIATATVLFRTRLYKEFKQEFEGLNFKMSDVPMWLVFSHASKFKYLEDITANYRMLKNSASHSEDIDKSFLFREHAMLIREHFAKKFNIPFNKNKARSKIYSAMIKECYFKKNPEFAWKYYIRMVSENAQSFFKPIALLFLLGSQYTIFDRFIEKLYSGTSQINKAVQHKH
jgi:glycosyltransferase involved in cell wall biosynthesis